MRILYIGGTGVISSACSALAVKQGAELYLLNRGRTERPVPAGARILHADIRDRKSVRNAIGSRSFDVVVDWIAYEPEHVQADIEMFADTTEQYIFISSASAYQTPPAKLPVTEETALENPIWEYSQRKIACESVLRRAWEERDFPMTIVRPSHTYDRTMIPVHGGFTVIERMRKGKKVVVPGDGSSIWVLTHHTDFATGFVGLMGNQKAIGEAFHITSDELLTWNLIYGTLAEVAGGRFNPVYVPSDVIAHFDPGWGDSLLGDKTHSMIFDNSKIKKFVPDFEAKVPFRTGAEEIVSWYDADAGRRAIDQKFDLMLDSIIVSFAKVLDS